MGMGRRSGGMPALPAGFRFHPTDEELIVHYLMNQAAAVACPVPIIAEVNIYKCDPWDLPAKAVFGENEWYFFSPRDRKYPNGARPNRAAGSGYWKATGTDKAILSSSPSSSSSPAAASEHIGVKKALVFYRGKPPRGAKTDWIMHEYRLTPAAAGKGGAAKRRPPPPASSSSSMRLDDWVLCRIYKKSNDFHLFAGDGEPEPEQEEGSTVNDHSLSLNASAADASPTSESEAPATDRHHDDDDEQLHLPGGAMAITKSCSLSDLLSTIDYSTLSQLLLDVVPSDAGEPQLPPTIYSTPPPSQTLNNNNNNNFTNDQISTTTRVDDYSGSDHHHPNHNGLKRFRSFDDGSNNLTKKQAMNLPSDSRTTMMNSYCNQQVADGSSSSSFQFQYSGLMSYPFMMNQQQLLLNNHLQMQ